MLHFTSFIKTTARPAFLLWATAMLSFSPLSAQEKAETAPSQNPVTESDTSVFANSLLSKLNKGTTAAKIAQIQNPAIREAASSIKKGIYDSKNRIRKYDLYESVDVLAKRLKTNSYSRFENPTGIYFEPGQDAVVVVEGLTSDNEAFLKIHDFGESKSGEQMDRLKNGVNVIPVTIRGLGYISFYTNDYKKPEQININILTGKVNGVFDSSVNTDKDWKKMLNNAACDVIDIVGKHVHLVYPVAGLKETCPDKGLELINLYDKIVNLQHEVMGLVKYGKQPKNRMFGRVAWGAFMFADGMGAGFGQDVIGNDIGNPDKLVKDAWGVAHEFGHVNQTRPGMKWVSTTEVTNNIFSAWAAWNIHPQNVRLEHEICRDKEGKPLNGARFNWYLNSALIAGEQWLCQQGPDKMKKEDYQDGGDHFVKLGPLWQLQLYFAVAKRGNPDFYPDIFEIVRNTDEKGLSDGQMQLNFMKNACDVTKQDLTDFFITAGMLKPIDKDMDDYSRAQLTITKEDCDNLVNYAKKYKKPDSPVIYYISANSVNAYKDELPVTGQFGEGVKNNEDGTVTISHDAWKNVAAFETWKDGKLIKIAIAGTGSPDNSSSTVSFPNDATSIKAVSWDGKRTSVYGKQ